MNIKDITMPLIIHYYLLRAFRTYPKSFTLNHNVRFSAVYRAGRWHNAVRVRASSPVCIVLIIPGHSREVPRQGCGHS